MQGDQIFEKIRKTCCMSLALSHKYLPISGLNGSNMQGVGTLRLGHLRVFLRNMGRGFLVDPILFFVRRNTGNGSFYGC